MRPTFKIGDRVTRPADVYKDKSPLLHGQVVNTRFGHWTHYGYYPEIYDVQWDGQPEVSNGFLPHGLELEPHPTPPQEDSDGAERQHASDETYRSGDR